MAVPGKDAQDSQQHPPRTVEASEAQQRHVAQLENLND
jgi:hypothetical protein